MKRVMLWGTLVFILAPVFATVVVATSVDFSAGPWGSGITTDWLEFAWQPIGPVLARSLLIALVVVIIDLVLASVLGLWIARNSSALTSAVSALLSLPLAVPGIAISVALLAAFPTLRPSGLLLVAAHVVFTLPFALGALVPVYGSARLISEEEVASTLGASRSKILMTVTVPAAAVAIGQAAAMVFALSFGEFNLSFFVNPPSAPTIPFALFDSHSTRRLEFASAQTVLFIACILPVLALLVVGRHLARKTPR